VAKVVPCSIGVEGSPYEDDTITFFKVFYQAVASGRSLKDAVGQARTALKFGKVPDAEIPQLVCRPDVDAANVFLVDAKRASRRRGLG
jgi:hypothetical protein